MVSGESIEKSTLKERDRTLEKVTKLLAVAQDTAASEGEAQNALVRAQLLLDKSGLSMEDAAAWSKDYGVEAVEDLSVLRSRYFVRWHDLLAGVVAPNFRCKYFFWDRTDKVSRMNYTHIYMMGKSSDVVLAREVFRAAVAAIEHLAHKHLQDLPHHINDYGKSVLSIKVSAAKQYKADYILGFIAGLNSQYLKQVQENRSLIVVVPKEVEDTYKEKVKGKPIKSVQKYNATASYYRGMEDGEQWNRHTIEKPIDASESAKSVESDEARTGVSL